MNGTVNSTIYLFILIILFSHKPSQGNSEWQGEIKTDAKYINLLKKKKDMSGFGQFKYGRFNLLS